MGCKQPFPPESLTLILGVAAPCLRLRESWSTHCSLARRDATRAGAVPCLIGCSVGCPRLPTPLLGAFVLPNLSFPLEKLWVYKAEEPC